MEGTRFIIGTAINLYLFVLVIRMILAYVGSNYFDPITQFIVRLTDPIVKPVRRFIPNYRRIEFSTLALIFAIDAIKFACIYLLTYGTSTFSGLIILSIGDLLNMVISALFYAILLQAIMSWVQPMSPANRTLYQITSIIMNPLHRIIPPIGGIDITPIPAMIGLQFLLIVLVNPLMQAGNGVMLG